MFIALAICLSFGLAVSFAGTDGADLYNTRCAKCHGEDGAKTSGASGGKAINGLSVEEAKAKLMGYKDGSYGGAKKKTMMRMLQRYEDAQIEALAQYIGSL